APARLGLSPCRATLYMEVASTQTSHRVGSLPLPPLGVVVILSASLSKRGTGAQCRLLSGAVAAAAGGILRVDSVFRKSATDAPRASHGDLAGFSRRRHRQCAVGNDRVDVACPRLPGDQLHVAPGHDRLPARLAPLAHAQAAVLCQPWRPPAAEP